MDFRQTVPTSIMRTRSPTRAPSTKNDTRLQSTQAIAASRRRDYRAMSSDPISGRNRVNGQKALALERARQSKGG
jgi:hypothetical protein